MKDVNRTQIIVKNPREDTTTQYIRLTADTIGLMVEYGNVSPIDLEFISQEYDWLSYRDTPDVRNVFDGVGWNVVELSALVTVWANEDFEQVEE